MESITLISVFIEGILSFISPCVLPLIPLYMSYLTSSCKEEDEEGNITYKTAKVIITTLCFVLGISTVFFILGISVDLIGSYIDEYRMLINIFGGIILVLLALNGFGVINVSFINREHRLDTKTDFRNMNYFKAYLLGFIFSFAWTPCIGPMLSNVILLALSENAMAGHLYILLYAIGFTVPFIILGVFYKKGLEFLKTHKNLLLKLSMVASIIILLFGINMIYNGTREVVRINSEYNRLLKYENAAGNTQSNQSDDIMYNFELTDQYGNVHKLYDYQGKYVVLNFVASWCTYCEKEIPDYEKFAAENDDVICLYVMAEGVNRSNGGSTTADFIKDNDIKISVLNDDGSLFAYMGISSFPTMAFIGPDSTYIGYQSGMLSYEIMEEILDMAEDLYEEGH